MKALMALVMTAVLLTTACAPALTVGRVTRTREPSRWENVTALPAGTPIVVTMASGGRLEGTFVDADSQTLRVDTSNGPVALSVVEIGRVQRVLGRARNRVQRAGVAAAVGTAAVAATAGVLCMAMSGRWCWLPGRPREFARTALIFGAAGAIRGRPLMTIYARP